MKHLFYELVRLITNLLTGIDNRHCTFGDLMTWNETSKMISNVLSVCCILMAVVAIVMVVTTCTRIYHNHSYSKEIEL